jgi:serine/threonine protein kinase
MISEEKSERSASPEGRKTFQKDGSPERNVKRPCLRVKLPPKRAMSFELRTDPDGHTSFQYEVTNEKTGQNQTVTIRDCGEAGFKLSDFNLGSELGRGEGGGVRIAYHRPSSQHYALKEVNISDKANRHQLEKELKNLKACKHINTIVRFFDVCYDEGRVYMVLELMSWGSLEALIEAQWQDDRARYIMDEQVVSAVLFSILSALQYLHDEAGLIHADIKPSNCLLSRGGNVKLSDFGICRSVQGAQRSDIFSGTMGYMSPERLNGQGLSLPADIWSVGVVALEYATGRHPYAPPPEEEDAQPPPLNAAVGNRTRQQPAPAIDLIQRILDDPPPAPDSAQLSAGLAGLIRRCLVKDPAVRPSAAALLSAPGMADMAALSDDERRAAVADWLRGMPAPHADLIPNLPEQAGLPAPPARPGP